MQEKIFNFLKKYNITNSGETYLVGFSGGQDSLCLIDILHRRSQEHNFKIIACHLNHNWRDEESKKEQCSCMEFCEERAIEFYTKTLDASAKQTEESAREERYEFFDEIALKTSAKGVFTAHTKTDNTETILYRIIKGTGIKGLCAIPKSRQAGNCTVFRPMLDVTREETEKYCTQHNLKPAHDTSNEDSKYARNNIRLNIIPKLKKINPNLDDALQNLSQIAQDYEEIVDEILEQKPLTAHNYRTFSDALKKISIHKFLIENQFDYSAKRIEEIKDFLDTNTQKPCGNTISLTTGAWLFASKTKIEILHQTKADKIEKSLALKLNQDNFFAPTGQILSIKEFAGEAPKNFPKETEFKAFVTIPETLTELELRTRREGDIIQPFGSCGTMKLKKYFINKGVPEHKRDEILLIASKNEILWAIGVGLSEKLKVAQKPTHTIELRSK